MQVKKRNGRLEPLDKNKINLSIERACIGIEGVSVSDIALNAALQLYDKVPTTEIDKAIILSAREKIISNYKYSYVAARLLLNNIYKESFGEGVESEVFDLQYRKAFVTNIKKLVKVGRLDPRMLDYDLKKLSEAIVPERDNLLKYMGVQLLYDSYFQKDHGRRMETPQTLWMRVAMGLCFNENNKEDRVIEMYTAISKLHLMPATPTLFNSGTVHPQLSSCFLHTMEDSLDGIMAGGVHRLAKLSKHAGGLGISMTNIRATGSPIKGTNGESDGIIPWCKLLETMLVATNQSGLRPGAAAIYLEPWHMDIESFIELKKPIGDEFRLLRKLFSALWIPDYFMECKEDKDCPWYLFDPKDTPDLIALYGNDFKNRYLEYVEMGKAGKIRMVESNAYSIWKKAISNQLQFGGPWITFKDTSNLRYTQAHEGTITCSNLCTETLLHSKPSLFDEKDYDNYELGETSVCSLMAVNLSSFHTNGFFDWESMRDTVKIAVRMLDNGIDINFYPIKEAKNANLLHRPIMVGKMGWADLLCRMKIPFDSDKAKLLEYKIQKEISFTAIQESADLAQERGSYPTFEGSTWSQGKLPYDTWVDWMHYKNRNVSDFLSEHSLVENDNLDGLRDTVKKGMRNSLLTANQPTAKISYIVGCSQSIEPYNRLVGTYTSTSGEHLVFNEIFIEDMIQKGLWTPEFIDDLTDNHFELDNMSVDEDIKQLYKCAYSIDQHDLITQNAIRQIWTDQGTSLNLFASSQKLSAVNSYYTYAWDSGCKTTYYLRATPASGFKNDLKAQPLEITIPTDFKTFENENNDLIPTCRIDDPDCEVCN